MNHLNAICKKIKHTVYFLSIGIVSMLLSCQTSVSSLDVQHKGQGRTDVNITRPGKYLLLPIEESAGESRMTITVDNQVVQTFYIRLAVGKTDYQVPLDLSEYQGKTVTLSFHNIADEALCWKELELSETFDAENRELYRPLYHFSPPYGWMNDPNGMVYKDGEYHLYYQYNPYGSMWGNLHWGHAASRDLVHWEHLPVAIASDELGMIFSGSAVVDEKNCAGFGAGAIVAFYTSAGEKQTQSIAYSLDNGRTFVKYDKNPVLTADIPDFRDPKVIWHEPTQKWILILAAGQEMQLFSSANLKEWEYESSFGEGEGAHGGVWECPDLIELPVEGTNQQKWVLICNLNPGGPFGGSAAQYFVGTFDGKTFVNESPAQTKWMDWGKDHYATVTWSNAPGGRTIAIAWMSNWEYANQVPTTQFRSSNSVPRDLSLYAYEGETYIKCTPSPELNTLQGEELQTGIFKVDNACNLDHLLKKNTGCYKIDLQFTNADAEIIGFRLFNGKGEEVECYYNLVEQKFFMDRTKSGLTGFNEHFPALTIAPVEKGNSFKLSLYVDKASIEAFGNDGRFVMTNLVFPAEPYNRMNFYSKGGTYDVEYTITNLTIR